MGHSGAIFTLSLWSLMEYFQSHSFTVSMMGVITSLVFLILPWLPQYFLQVSNETLSLLGSLYLSTIVHSSDVCPRFFWKLLPFCSLTKNPEILLPPPVKENTQWKRLCMNIYTCIWMFYGYWKNIMWKFQGSTEKEVEFPGLIKKISCWIFIQ